MVWNNPPKFVPSPPKKGNKITPENLAKSGSEDGHQSALFAWAADNVGKYPQLKWLHAIPNGGSRHIVEAMKMVAAGTKSGVWDIFLPMPERYNELVKIYHGCYIEMKKEKYRTAKDGGLSKEQLEFGAYATSIGYYCRVCYNWTEARDVLIKYLEGKL